MDQSGTSRRYWDESQKVMITMDQPGTSRRYIWFPKVHLGLGGAIWLCDEAVSSGRSVTLFTGLPMGVLILVNYSPIWKWILMGSQGLFWDMWRVSWTMLTLKDDIGPRTMNRRTYTAELYHVDPQRSLIGHQIGHVLCLLWIYRSWDFWIMMSMRVEGPGVMSQNVPTEKASRSRLNWRREMNLDTFGIWVLFRAFGYQKWEFGTAFGIWSFFGV